MRRFIKSLLTYLALLGLTAVSIVSVVRAVRTEMRRGPAFDAPMLGAWLVAPTKPAETPTILRRAARQLEQEFHEQVDRSSEYEALDEARRRTYEDNWQRLLVSLLRQHADAYAATPSNQREAFINQRLAQFATWYAFEDGKKVGAGEFLTNVRNGNNTAFVPLDAGERKRIREFGSALQSRVFWKTFGNWLPGGRKPPAEREDR